MLLKLDNLTNKMSRHLETVLEINLNALTHNYNYLRSKITKKVKFLAVVKAFGYGSDALIVAKHLEKIGADYLAVAYIPEGIALRKAGIKLPIMVLHPQPTNFKDLLPYQLEPSIYSERTLRLFLECIQPKRDDFIGIHLKFNSGLNRLGFHENVMPTIGKLLKLYPKIKVLSMLSHMAASEDLSERTFSLEQITQFKEASTKMIQILGYTPLLHQCNTSGILNYPEAHFSMVRSGIGLYGFGNEARYDNALIPIASLKSVISQIHSIKKGDSIGYNRGCISNKKMRTATIPIGHADGIDRIYGHGKGYVTINNMKAPIVGNVCMDMIMVDITDINCQEGQEVIIFDSEHSAVTLSELAGTISYELLTGITNRIKRVVTE